MFSQTCVILSTICLMATRSLPILIGPAFTAHFYYGAVGTHPTGMLSCFIHNFGIIKIEHTEIHAGCCFEFEYFLKL